jgi:hypothetical protein
VEGREQNIVKPCFWAGYETTRENDCHLMHQTNDASYHGDQMDLKGFRYAEVY